MPLPLDELPFDEAHFVSLIERLFPEDWWGPMKANPESGYELIQMFAAIGARLSLAVNRMEGGSLAIFSQGGQLTEVPVEFFRPTNASGAVTLKAGTVVTTSRSDRRFVLLTDVVFGALDVGPFAVNVRAVAPGWEWNVPGPVTLPGGDVLPGEVDTIARMRTIPPYGDPTIAVRQTGGPTIEGRAPMLDGLAEDRGLSRRTGENDDGLSYRVRTLADVVTPAAIKRVLHALLDPLGLPFDFIETFEHRYQECYDAPSPNAGTPSFQAVAPLNPDYNNRTFVYDDPRDPDPFRNREMDFAEYRAAFVVVVRTDLTVWERGFAYDDPGMVPTDFHPDGGPHVGKPWRQTPAYDCTTADNPDAVFGCCYDGYDVTRGAVYAAVGQQLNSIKAGGVTAVVDTIRP